MLNFGLKFFVDDTLIVNSGRVSVNCDLQDLLFDFMGERHCSHKYVLLNVAQSAQANWVIFLKIKLQARR
jgi:hypothetical protein